MLVSSTSSPSRPPLPKWPSTQLVCPPFKPLWTWYGATTRLRPQKECRKRYRQGYTGKDPQSLLQHAHGMHMLLLCRGLSGIQRMQTSSPHFSITLYTCKQLTNTLGSKRPAVDWLIAYCSSVKFATMSLYSIFSIACSALMYIFGFPCTACMWTLSQRQLVAFNGIIIW